MLFLNKCLFERYIIEEDKWDPWIFKDNQLNPTIT